MPVAAIATALDAPANYLGKTLQTLASAGVLDSQRGPGGGFRLARAADAMTVADVIGVVEEPKGSGMCLLGDQRCSGVAPCAAHVRWEAARREAAEPFRRTTIADLLAAAN